MSPGFCRELDSTLVVPITAALPCQEALQKMDFHGKIQTTFTSPPCFPQFRSFSLHISEPRAGRRQCWGSPGSQGLAQAILGSCRAPRAGMKLSPSLSVLRDPQPQSSLSPEISAQQGPSDDEGDVFSCPHSPPDTSNHAAAEAGTIQRVLDLPEPSCPRGGALDQDQGTEFLSH